MSKKFVAAATSEHICAAMEGMIPVYINPLLAPGTIRHMLKGEPQEHVVVDSVDTMRRFMEQANAEDGK